MQLFITFRPILFHGNADTGPFLVLWISNKLVTSY